MKIKREREREREGGWGEGERERERLRERRGVREVVFFITNSFSLLGVCFWDFFGLLC
ncbi:unnamed protein product, partial [Vitis vinifera]